MFIRISCIWNGIEPYEEIHPKRWHMLEACKLLIIEYSDPFKIRSFSMILQFLSIFFNVKFSCLFVNSGFVIIT